MPLPKSAAAATRWSGVGSSPSTIGLVSRNHIAESPRAPKDPRAIRSSNASQNPVSARSPQPRSSNVTAMGPLSPGPGSVGAGTGSVGSASDSVGAHRSAVARETSLPSASSAASIHCTFRPGRNVRTSTSSGANGTGRRSSIVRRATNAAGPGS